MLRPKGYDAIITASFYKFHDENEADPGRFQLRIGGKEHNELRTFVAYKVSALVIPDTVSMAISGSDENVSYYLATSDPEQERELYGMMRSMPVIHLPPRPSVKVVSSLLC